jgi:hypothetical protein
MKNDGTYKKNGKFGITHIVRRKSLDQEIEGRKRICILMKEDDGKYTDRRQG